MSLSRMSPGEIVFSATSRNATTASLSFSRSIVMAPPLASARARCAATRTSSNLLGTLSMQSSTVMRAMAGPFNVMLAANDTGQCPIYQ
jgi:hypothetical protein